MTTAECCTVYASLSHPDLADTVLLTPTHMAAYAEYDRTCHQVQRGMAAGHMTEEWADMLLCHAQDHLARLIGE